MMSETRANVIRHKTIGVFSLFIWIARLGVLGLVVAAVVSLDSASTEQHRTDVKQLWQARADQISLNLQAEILQNVQTVWGLAANVAIDPDIGDERFNELAPVIFRLAPALRNIGLAPDLVIRHVYPLRGNEAAIGLDLTRQSLPPEQIAALKSNRRAVFTGPIDLVQGGKGLASRVPIFIEDSNEFWGVISVILDLSKLNKTAGLVEARRTLRFVLSASSDAKDTDAVFYGSSGDEWTDPVSSTLKMPGTTWTLFAEPVGSWPTAPEHPLIFRSALLLVAATIIGAVFWLTHLMLRERQMQIRFWGLFEFAPIGIGLFSARDGRLIRANPEFRGRFGSNTLSIDFFEHSFDANGAPQPDPLGLLKTLHQTLRLDAVQVYYPTHGESVAPVRLRGLELQNTDSDPVIWLITEDISEQTKAERLKNEFISTVSHELRTPLTSISGSLGLIEGGSLGELPERIAKMVSIAYRNSNHLKHLVDDLLDMEKLVSGKMTMEFATISPLSAIEDSVERLNSYALNRNLSITVEAAREIPSVRADQTRLEQAFANLLSNAIKFSPDDGRVDVRLVRNEKHLQIRVTDQGPGVPESFRPRIFQKFAQADSSDTRRKGGTGLGLAITREIMEQMGGSVGFESSEGHGATFWLQISIETPQQ